MVLDGCNCSRLEQLRPEAASGGYDEDSPTLALLRSGYRSDHVQRSFALCVVRTGRAELDFLPEYSGRRLDSVGGDRAQRRLRRQQSLSVISLGSTSLARSYPGPRR